MKRLLPLLAAFSLALPLLAIATATNDAGITYAQTEVRDKGMEQSMVASTDSREQESRRVALVKL
ncbi:MAG: hypothetical protein ABI837_04160 [Acidobacteriota bacterium]